MANETYIFSQEDIEAVWQKARIIPNNNPHTFRQDYAGAWIRRDQYGLNSEYGWEIDHIVPISNGGTHDIDNLLPLHYLNNMRKGDNYPEWQTEVCAQGIKNEEFIRNWSVKP